MDLTLAARYIDGMTHGTWKQRWELQFDPIPGKSLFQTFKNAFELFSGREYMGTIVETSPTEPLTVQWLTFKDVWQHAVEVASGLNFLLDSSPSVFMSLYAKNRPEWVICDLVTVMLGWSSVPIPASLDVKDIEYILAHAEVSVIVTSLALISNIRSVIQSLPKLHHIVIMDTIGTEEYVSLCSSFGEVRHMQHSPSRSWNLESSTSGSESSDSDRLPLKIVDISELALLGKDHLMKEPRLPQNEETAIATIVYTSGSTGRPKGAVNSYDRWNKFISYVYNMPMPIVRLSFMPLAHNTERQQAHLTTCYGGKMCFSRGDMSKIFEEFALVNPTTLSAAPRFYDSIYNQYQATLAQFKQDYPECMPSQAEAYCLEQYRYILGNAMQVLVVGGAAVSPFTKEFMGKCFNLPVFDGYGTTEAGGITADGKLYPGTEVKIVDCPDLGYTANDKPWPRGEVWARTLSMVSGYYKDPETTNEYFRDGWFITGDIVEVRNGNEFYIIDRRKNLFKLSQGVFVAPSSIENKLLVSDFVHQIYVYGDHTRSHLVAIVVPNLTNLGRWAVANGFLNPIDFVSQKGIDINDLLPKNTPESSRKMVVSENLLQAHFDAYAAHICSLPAAKAKVLKELHGTALKIQLPSYHTPAAVTLESEKWTAENKLVTPSDKPQRAALEKKYLDSISRMYAEIAESQDETTAFSDQIRDVVKEVTGVESGNQDGTEDLSSSFATDSLTVLRLIHTLNKQFNTNLSFVDIMRETGGRLTPDLIASVLSKHASKSKHQNGVLDPWSMQDARILSDLDTVIPVDDVLLGNFYTTANPTDKLQKVLVTGATGFLGFHLVCELLDTHPDTTFVLLIRASSEEEAKSRFFDTTAARQRAIFNDSERSRLQIIPGDFARPDLGVSPETYSMLTQEIDAIYHVGAAVNWIWGYDSVRDANVLGTIRLLVLATTHKLKYFYFVSSASTTIGVAVVPAEPSSPLMVDWNSKGPLEETSTMGKADIVHRSAYVISKWVAETIVKRSIQLGLPGCILRPGMITGHSKSGACHPTDFSPRLLIGLAQSLAGFTSDQPLEWMPVDFCAKAVVGLTMHFRDSILPVLYEAKALGIVPSFNIQNYSTATYNDIMMYMRSARINVQQMIYPVWRQTIVADQKSPLWPLLPFFGERSCSMYAQLMPAPQTYSILQSLGITCPPADEALFHTYIRYLKEEKLI